MVVVIRHWTPFLEPLSVLLPTGPYFSRVHLSQPQMIEAVKKVTDSILLVFSPITLPNLVIGNLNSQ